MKPSTPAAFRLVMDGSAAFADMEEQGMRIDVPYLDRIIVETGDKLREMEQGLRDDELFVRWKRLFGMKADVGSRQQLGKIVFDELGFKGEKTKAGNYKTDEEAFEDIELPFVRRWLDYQKLTQARTTFLVGLRQQVFEDGFVHPFFNLHLATTHRSSGTDPNLMNQPIRDKRLAKLIRRAFIPRDENHVLIEIDYSALEFKGAANFWLDEAMVAYASNPELDIHRDMAMECYLLQKGQVSKDCRSMAKNAFVFPTLYGSYYKNTGTSLWTAIRRLKLKRADDGVDLYQHLADRGISSPSQYTEHVKSVEENFNNRFPTWSKQKEIWWNLYLDRGWFELSTGFVCHGLFKYNNLMNTPIQGPSFHCLLWSLIQINAELKRRKMRSRVICEIHDSLLADVHRQEIHDYVEIATRIMTKDIRDHWKWIVAPLGVEVEICERNWFEKVPFKH